MSEQPTNVCGTCGMPSGEHSPSCRTQTKHLKVEYNPTTEHRFEVSQDPRSRERVQAIVNVFREIREDVPEFIGINILGSLSQGKELSPENARVTDIDLFAYVDVSILDAIEEPDAQNSYWQEKGKEIKRIIIESLKRLDGYSESLDTFGRDDIFVLLLREDSITEWYKRTFEGDDPGRDYVRMFFGMNTGIEINKYRLHFLHYLESQGSVGEQKWSEFVEEMIRLDKKVGDTASIRHLYPTTLEKAIEFYEQNPALDEESFTYPAVA